MASTYLEKTFSSAGNRKKWTWSGWVKRCNTDVSDSLFACAGSTNQVNINIESSTNGVDFWVYSGGSYAGRKTTNRKLRDCNGFYHIVCSFDSANATADDRMKIYINGERQTSFSTSTNPSQNLDGELNNNVVHQIGANGNGNNDFNGILAHVHFTDGYLYDADDFGETESTSGIWKPKTSPSVTYGTNGFFLKFQDSSSLGDDSSGNTNDFTLNGSGRQVLDTPSNVFATMNAVNGAAGSDYTLTNGNTTFGRTSSGNRAGFATLGVQTGKWYWEVEASAIGGGAYIGISKESNTYNSQAGSSQYAGSESGDIGYKSSDGNKVIGGTSTSYGNSYTTGDIIGVALDLDNDKLYFSKNGTWQNSGVPTSGATGTGAISITNSDYVWFASSSGQTNVVLEHNFGNGYFGTTAVASAENDDAGHGKFEYDVPAGYYALCTKNINTYG
jgi:hypothetical protein